MLTTNAVPPGEPVLVGTLRMHRFGRIRGRPVLAVEAYCPFCRERHQLEWPDPPFLPEAARPMAAPCRSGPFAGREVMVGLDETRRAEHGRLIHHFEQSRRRFEVEQRLRHQLADQRGLDRRHRREWDLPGPGAATARA